MTQAGTPFTETSRKILLLGSGELGKEVVIELMRYGAEVTACDSYANAPAMQTAHNFRVFSMLDGTALRRAVEEVQPDLIVPEVEAIATDTLVELEEEGYTVVPTARAAQLTMDREGIRKTAAEKLGLRTSRYVFVEQEEDFFTAAEEIGLPLVVKPLMSSSGKGQSIVTEEKDLQKAWDYSQQGGRAGKGRIIVEEFIPFDYEITLLTIRHRGGTSFCAPVGHTQVDGDYRESWQPHPMSDAARDAAEEIARKITDELGGYGLFGVEMFVRGDEVIFSEVSPRPHDTGMVTMISQNLSEFALHARAILGLPIPVIHQLGPACSRAIVVRGESSTVRFSNMDSALSEEDTELRIFGKPFVAGKRRMAVALSRAETVAKAREKAERIEEQLHIEL
ncbi:MAG: formate-dependent phosphoribosylglycinamide formyltransferase [Fibrobacterota bacterium]